MKNGSRLCGQVKFKVREFIPHTTNCFCSMCRKFHGAAYATFAVVRVQDLSLLSGKEALKKYKASNGTIRTFCGNCGSSLFYQDEKNENLIDVALGVMDDDPELEVEANIYTAYKADWCETPSSIPNFKEEHDLS